MPSLDPTFESDRPAGREPSLHFTPREWRRILEDPTFLNDSDNAFEAPRRLMGIAVRIVPDHSYG